MSLLLSRAAGLRRRCGPIPATLRRSEHRADRFLAAVGRHARRISLNDRRYADDDLTIGPLIPYQVFASSTRFIFTSGKPEARRHRLHGRPEP